MNNLLQRELKIHTKNKNLGNTVLHMSLEKQFLFETLKTDYNLNDLFFLVTTDVTEIPKDTVIYVSDISHGSISEVDVTLCYDDFTEQKKLTLESDILGKPLKSFKDVYKKSHLKDRVTFEQFLANFEKLLNI